jgi:hypothetical protein
VNMVFGEVFDREHWAWIAGHNGTEDGPPVEGCEGQQLRHEWEEADMDLTDLWDHYSRRLHPPTAPDSFILLRRGHCDIGRCPFRGILALRGCGA